MGRKERNKRISEKGTETSEFKLSFRKFKGSRREIMKIKKNLEH